MKFGTGGRGIPPGYYYDYARGLGAKGFKREKPQTMRPHTGSCLYNLHPYQYPVETDEVQPERRLEVAELRSGQLETLAMLRRMMTNGEELKEEVGDIKREQQALKESQDQLSEKVGQWEKETRNIRQAVQDQGRVLRGEIEAFQARTEEKMQQLRGEVGEIGTQTETRMEQLENQVRKLEQRIEGRMDPVFTVESLINGVPNSQEMPVTSEGSRRRGPNRPTLNKEKKKCKICGKELSPDYLKNTHEPKCQLRYYQNMVEEEQQGRIEIPGGQGNPAILYVVELAQSDADQSEN